MKIKILEVAGIKHAIYSMRNPLNSWDRADSYFDGKYVIGRNDLDLAQRLIKAGTEHSKFLRFITVWADWELPLYVWKEADTYKFLEKNSCSTMHKITSRPLTSEDFEWDNNNDYRRYMLDRLNFLIDKYKKTENDIEKKSLFREIVQDLPSSYLQKRTVVTNYAELRNIYFQRRNHKLKEWHEVCKWIESLPYAKELICLEG